MQRNGAPPGFHASADGQLSDFVGQELSQLTAAAAQLFRDIEQKFCALGIGVLTPLQGRFVAGLTTAIASASAIYG
jgi:hypothetical protein